MSHTTRTPVVLIVAAAPFWLAVVVAQIAIPAAETGDWSESVQWLAVGAFAAVTATAVAITGVRRARQPPGRVGSRPGRGRADDDTGTEFGPAPETLIKRVVSAMVLVILPLAIVGGITLRLSDTTSTTRIAVAVALALVLAPSVVVIAHTLRILTPVHRLTIGPDGVQLHGRQSISIPWREVESWWVGVPAGPLNRLIQREAVLAHPATHVRDPRAGHRPAQGRPRPTWLLCEPALMDATVAEVAAAFERFAPGKRSATPTGAAGHLQQQ